MIARNTFAHLVLHLFSCFHYSVLSSIFFSLSWSTYISLPSLSPCKKEAGLAGFERFDSVFGGFRGRLSEDFSWIVCSQSSLALPHFPHPVSAVTSLVTTTPPRLLDLLHLHTIVLDQCDVTFIASYFFEWNKSDLGQAVCVRPLILRSPVLHCAKRLTCLEIVTEVCSVGNRHPKIEQNRPRYTGRPRNGKTRDHQAESVILGPRIAKIDK